MKQIKISNQAVLPTQHGTFQIQAFKESDREHLVIYTDPIPDNPILRIHSECLTGDALGSLKCDCGEQLQSALKMIAQEGGMLIYHRQEGRNIGLLNKVNAYALQDQGFDTVSANHQLGFKADERTYDIIKFILGHFEINRVKLLTNNPEKVKSLTDIEVTQRVPLIIEPNPYNEKYLSVKKSQMGHIL
ncbi:MAG TPA: GTP cyclohydrolase II [Sulfurovum sp.]|nr:GTP cyclohydrolase II [Sulfurovum sp.]